MQTLEEKDNELRRKEEDRKHLISKLCTTQKQVEDTEQKLKKLEGEHEKAVKAIQAFVEREHQMRDANSHKERKILELETELRKRRNSHDLVSLRDLGVKNAENDSCKQVNIYKLRLIFDLVCRFLRFRMVQNYLKLRLTDT